MSARAQQEQLWLTYNLQVKLNPHWSLLADVNHRRVSHLYRFNHTQALRTGIQLEWPNHHSLAAGYAWFLVNNPSSQLLKGFQENRLWQQWRYAPIFGKAVWQHRLRLEQRWQQRPLNGYINQEFSVRYRYFTQWQQPFKPQAALGWLANAELMLQTGAQVQQPLNQLRLSAGLTLQPNKHTQWVLAYLFIHANPHKWFTNKDANTIRVTLHQTF